MPTITDTDTTQSDFQEGTLTDVEADSGDYLRLSHDVSLSYTGSLDRVDLGTPTALQLSSNHAFTWEGWMFIRSFTGDRNMLICKNNDMSGSPYDYLLGITGTDYLNAYDGSNWGGVHQNIPLNKWIHLAFSYDGSTMHYIYNGKKVGDRSFSWSLDTSNNIKIGGYASGHNIDGLYNEVRFWDHYRSPTDIQNNFYKRLNGDEIGLIAYYPMIEDSGSTVYDYAGTSNGTIYDATWSSSNPQYYMNINEDNNRVSPQLNLSSVGTVKDSLIELEGDYVQNLLQFDGYYDYFNSSLSNSVTEATIEGWVKRQGSGRGGHPSVFDLGSWGHNSGFGLWEDGGVIELRDSGYSHPNIGENFNTDTWEHFAIVYDGNKIELFRDGSSIYEFDNPTVNSTDIFWSGRREDQHDYFNGLVFDIRIWNHARTQIEIQDNMDKRLNGNESGLVAYYKLEEGSGDTVIDSAGDNDGTITDATWRQDVIPDFQSGKGIIIETRISTDNGSTWSTWTECINGESIPDLPYGTDSSLALLECRQYLSMNDPVITPTINSLSLEINGEFMAFFGFPY